MRNGKLERWKGRGFFCLFKPLRSVFEIILVNSCIKIRLEAPLKFPRISNVEKKNLFNPNEYLGDKSSSDIRWNSSANSQKSFKIEKKIGFESVFS